MSYMNGNQEVFDNKSQNKEHSSHSGTLSFARVFGYMTIGLIITFGVAVLLGFIYTVTGLTDNSGAFNGVTLGITIGAAIAIIILTFVMASRVLKSDKSLVIPSIIYVSIFGVMLSPLTIVVPWQILALALGLTTSIFLLITLIALLTKGRVGGIALLAMGLFFGAGIVALFSLIFIWANPAVGATMVWICDFAIFGAFMLISIVDVARIKQITDAGQMTPNLELYCAITIYTDFIYLLVRLIYYLMIMDARNR